MNPFNRKYKDRTFAGRSFLHLETVDSTNRFTVSDPELMSQGGLVVYADRQTGGRGRLGRRWHSGTEGNLFATFVIHQASGEWPVHAMPLFAGLAVYYAIEEIMSSQGKKEEISIKWPNDILVNNKKICGILCESRKTGSTLAIATGIGVNVTGTEMDFPEGIREKIITLELLGIIVSRDTLLELLADSLETVLQQVNRRQHHILFRKWEAISSSIGKKVCFEQDGERFAGIIQGLDMEGRLAVITANGTTVSVMSGEVVFSRHNT